MRGFLLVCLILVLLAGGSALVGTRVYRAAGPLAMAQDVVVPRGGLNEVGAALVSAGVVRSRLAFKLAAVATMAEGPLHAAELHFPANASLAAVLDVLRDGRAVEHRVTIAEGLAAAQIAQIVARQGNLLSGDLAVPAEGAVLPETYVFQRGVSANSVVSRMRAAMTHVVELEWSGRAQGLGLHTPREAVILASIVEHEARLPQERPMIARVFLNRLAAGMRLQADPTVSYGAEGGLGVLVRPISRDDLARVDSYNTYVVAGLPAGPICSPGLASLKAVLHPASGDALYFVADGTGGHLFSASLAQHEANVAHYRARMDAASRGTAR
jgi:UPF0755 protein